jgi:hypothetical protein
LTMLGAIDYPDTMKVNTLTKKSIRIIMVLKVKKKRIQNNIAVKEIFALLEYVRYNYRK